MAVATSRASWSQVRPSAPRPSQARSGLVAAALAAVQRCPAVATVTSRAKHQGPGPEQQVRVQAQAWLRPPHQAACSLSSRSPAEGDSPRCQHQPPSPGWAGGTPAGPRHPTERGSPTAHRHGIGGTCCEGPLVIAGACRGLRSKGSSESLWGYFGGWGAMQPGTGPAPVSPGLTEGCGAGSRHPEGPRGQAEGFRPPLRTWGHMVGLGVEGVT